MNNELLEIEVMRFPRVLVIYNEPVLPKDHPDAASEHDIIATSELIEKILQEGGFPTRRIGVSTDPQVLLDELRNSPPDAVFNLFEGLANQTATEISVVGMLEWLNIPFTGSPSFAIAVGRDKIRTKFLLQGAGLPTPDFAVVEQMPCPRWTYEWPAIVKPACQDSSVGIEQSSVVVNQEQLEKRVNYILNRYQGPALIEQFVFGREFHVNIIEDPGDSPTRPIMTMIPLAEVRFEYESGRRFWPIYSYNAKWNIETEEYLGTPLDTEVELPTPLADRIRRICREAFRLTGLRDYGRVDIRLSEDGMPSILEVNPNPYLNSIALLDGFKTLGRSHSDFIVEMIWAALGRSGKNWARPARRATARA
jgi:D-alanine-D-alanine ligase